MATRRPYLYALSAIALAVLLVGLDGLLVTGLHALGLGGVAGVVGSRRQRDHLGLFIAMAIIGAILWAVPWTLALRGLRPSTPDVPEERGSALPAAYMWLVTGTLLAIGGFAAFQLLVAVARKALSVPRTLGPDVDNAASLSLFVITGAALIYHAAIWRRDQTPAHASSLRERLAARANRAPGIVWLYCHAAALLGLVMLAVTLSTLAGLVFDKATGAITQYTGPNVFRRHLAEEMAGAIGWGIVFAAHSWFANRLARGSVWRLRPSGQSLAGLRIAYYMAASALAATVTIAIGWQALSTVLAALLGGTPPFEPGPGLQTVVRPTVTLLPWAVAWYLHHRWLENEVRMGMLPNVWAAVGRAQAAGIGLVGIAAFAIGAAGVMGLLLDIALGGNRTGADIWRSQLANFLAVGALGSVLWLWNWAHLQWCRATAPAEEARSKVRRAYLLLVVTGMLLASLSSLMAVVGHLFSGELATITFRNGISELSIALGALLVDGGLAIYHAYAAWRDHVERDKSAGTRADEGQPGPGIRAIPTARG